MHLWLRLGIVQVNLASALALHKRSFCRIYHKNSVTIRNKPTYTWPKKKKSQEIILAISCSNKATSV